MAKKLRICETVLRDGHQSILATRMRYEQMEPVLGLLDEIGYEALECWGGATYDSCLRFLNEDPWERLRKLKSNLKNTPLQMLLRGQNLLGYKHYSDDVVEAFCNAAVKNLSLIHIQMCIRDSAKVVITKGEAERVSIKPYENVKTNYRKYLSTILPEEWIEVTNTFNNMYQYKMALSNENIKRKVDRELSNQMNNQMDLDLEQDTSQLSSDKVLSNDEDVYKRQWQSNGLKIRVSTVRFCPEAPFVFHAVVVEWQTRHLEGVVSVRS